VTINWSDSTDADDDSITYYIHFLNSSPPTYNDSTTNLYKAFTDLTDNETYYWYIIANDGTENSTSETRQFTINTSLPSLNFEDPTPTDGERLTDNYIYVNVTATHGTSGIDNCTLIWNSTHNYSMTRVGTGLSVSCFKNMTTSDGINYTYSVIANTTDGVEGTTGNRTNLENTKPQLNISYPGNNSNITETSTYLNWSSSDAEGDNITHYVYGNSTRNSTLLSLYNGTDLNYSWQIDDGTYYWYVVANDSYETNTSSEYKFNVDVFSIPSPSSGGGGGGGSSVTYEQKSLGTLAAGSTKVVAFTKSATLAMTEITVTVKNKVTNVKIKVDVGSLPSGASVPSSAQGSVYKYIEITKTGMADDDIEKAVIKFKVSKEWLTNKNYGIDAVSLHRYYNKKWEKLETTRTGFSAEYY
ncbi:PGF-pre-PGF domain-containing protein, partial [Candidatus Woesearchaeota archaeon]|nr:PGF-pre-PGF domain-containing protein [Candidatus Woesearchaeota archaeon]